jgi:hypothetical protein
MWAGSDDQREQIKQAGLELMPGELLAAATGEGAELEGITWSSCSPRRRLQRPRRHVLAGNSDTRVYRLAPRHPTHGVVAPFSGADTVLRPHPHPPTTWPTATMPAPSITTAPPTARSRQEPTFCS